MYSTVIVTGLVILLSLPGELVADEEQYELVNVHKTNERYEKRAVSGPLPSLFHIEFQMVRGTVKLRLRRNAAAHKAIPVTFEGQPGKKLYVTVDQNVGIYQDVRLGAAVTVTTTGNGNKVLATAPRVEGTFHVNGSRYQITPDTSTPKHRVQKLATEIEYHSKWKDDYIDLSPPFANVSDDIGNRQTHARVRRDTATRNTMGDYQVDTQFMMDHTIWKHYLKEAAGDEASAVSLMNCYFIHIYNGIDLAYKTIDVDKWGYSIKIHLLGYHVAATVADSWWTENSVTDRQATIKDTIVDCRKTLKEIGKWATRDGRSWRDPDHTMLFTRYDIASFNKNDLGCAAFGGICRPGLATSLIQATDVFDVWSTAAHELGHNLGARHDGDKNNCVPSDAYIMTASFVKLTPAVIGNFYTFSECSIKAIGDHLSGVNDGYPKVCLLNKVCQSDASEKDIQVLPGKKYSLNEQCEFYHGAGFKFYKNPNFKHASICIAIECTLPGSGRFRTRYPGAMEGTKCAKNKCCRRGICSADCSDPVIATPGESCELASLAVASPDDCTDQSGYSYMYGNKRNTCLTTALYHPELCFKNSVIAKKCCQTCHESGLVSHNTPVNGGWSDWSSWGDCTQSCGRGTKQRTRTCTNPAPANGGNNCRGEASQDALCFLVECPVDGGWSIWSPWGRCTVNCGGGIKKRRRACNNPSPAHGGSGCSGDVIQTTSCGQSQCPVHGAWSPWSQWEPCSKTCGGSGVKKRTRKCNNPRPQNGGDPCDGDAIEASSCTTPACPVNGRWSKWSTLGHCSTTCGKGTRRRIRTCDNPAPSNGGKDCRGASSRTVSCSLAACPVNGRWSKWSALGKCSTTCGEGTRRRTRTCDNPAPSNGGKDCRGASSRTVSCTSPACPESLLYPYGKLQGDRQLKCKSAFRCEGGQVDTPMIQYLDHTLKGIQIHLHGFVTSNVPFYGLWPRSAKDSVSKRKKREGFVLFAPFWTINQFRFGAVYYHVYDLVKDAGKPLQEASTKHVLARAKSDVHRYGIDKGVDPKWLLVVTWANMLPSFHSKRSDKPNTFQFILAYDPESRSTHVMFLYDTTGWTDPRQPNLIGYYIAKDNDEYYEVLAQSGKKAAFTLDNAVGNTGVVGTHLYRVSAGKSGGDNKEYECIQWYQQELVQLKTTLASLKSTLACPCHVLGASFDKRWQYDKSSTKTCYQELWPKGSSTQYCCYAKSGALITRNDVTGGHALRYHPVWHRSDYMEQDATPKQWCCVQSDNCDKFHDVRPQGDCVKYISPRLARIFGDPHLQTLDGFRYMFNGLGEYTLVETADFTLQGRMVRARNADRDEINATICNAIAVSSISSDRVHVEVNGTDKGLLLYIGDRDASEQFKLANSSDYLKGVDVLITKDTSRDAVVVVFKTGYTVTVNAQSNALDIAVGIPADSPIETRGLLGVANDNVTDDLTTLDEKQLDIDTVNERIIFHEFGESWRVPSEDSLFFYKPGENYSTYNDPDYEPIFSDEAINSMTSEQMQRANAICGANKECIFDFAVTGDEAFAQATLKTSTENSKVANILANSSPRIFVIGSTNVTLGEKTKFTVTAADPDNDRVSIALLTPFPEGSAFDENTGIFVWTPRNRNNVTITFVAIDSRNATSSLADVTVNFCDCSDRGRCQFDQLTEGESANARFRYVTCSCDIGWTSKFCEEEVDGCEDNPCSYGTHCTDQSPEQEKTMGKSFVCGACPAGYLKHNATEICLDVDECSNVTLNSCQYGCVNKQPGFKCTCPDEQKLHADGRHCLGNFIPVLLSAVLSCVVFVLVIIGVICAVLRRPSSHKEDSTADTESSYQSTGRSFVYNEPYMMWRWKSQFGEKLPGRKHGEGMSAHRLPRIAIKPRFH